MDYIKYAAIVFHARGAAPCLKQQSPPHAQSGAEDLCNNHGSWALANFAMAAALEHAGYDHVFCFGSGGHSLRHGGSVLGETLAWLFAGEGGVGGRSSGRLPPGSCVGSRSALLRQASRL